MPNLRIGIQLASLRQPFKKALQTAAKLGADSVEIDARQMLKPAEMTATATRHVRKMLDELDLSVCAIAFPTRRGYHVTEDLDRRVEATKQAMQMAYSLGAPVVINRVGRIPDEDTTERSTLHDVLADLGRHGLRIGSRLAVESGAEDPQILRSLLDSLPEGAIGINLDPGDFIIHGFSAQEATSVLGSDVAHVHARDGVRDLSLGRGLETTLGRGSVDFAEIIAILENFAYRGAYTIKRDHCPDPVTEIGYAVQYLREM